MAGNRIDLTLGISADVSQAKQQFAALKRELDNLSNIKTNTSQNSFSQEILKATQDAKQLKTMLQGAFNMSTGQLNLTTFQRSLALSGQSLKDFQKSMLALGPDGEKAFNSVAMSIANASPQLEKANTLTTKLWTSFQNVARYQLSTSILRGFTSAIRNAVDYAKDLNKSLTDISIVTGYSTDRMAKFALEANKSAQALSSTTNEYTKASLIYFQQGLDDKAVKERTDITMKMAAVTGQSANEVSDQMTAVWNNFAKHGEDLQSFSDKMTALGAATASSSSEIATGLEKFAATADTVGLSFDYASAALATVTATTRQSADTVGTAFKTLFARLESLKLGDTLEDGTDLTKYSLALQAVGVNIKDANGELKDMDTIIDETMGKWQTLNKDEQVALAQTVAGMRQYTQFIALMDSADFFRKNLETARESEGVLNSQFESYEEGWEAASKRVQNAWQGVYDKLIDSDVFINLLNGVEVFVKGISKAIDILGGFKGTLGLIGTLVTTVFSKQIGASITNAIARFSELKNYLNGTTEAQAAAFRSSAISLLKEQTEPEGTNQASSVQAKMVLNRLDYQDQMQKKMNQLTEAEKEAYQIRLKQMQTEEEYVQLLADEAVKLNAQRDTVIDISNFRTPKEMVKNTNGYLQAFEAAQDAKGQAGILGLEPGKVSMKAFRSAQNVGSSEGQGAQSWLQFAKTERGQEIVSSLAKPEEAKKIQEWMSPGLVKGDVQQDQITRGNEIAKVFEQIVQRVAEAQAAIQQFDEDFSELDFLKPEEIQPTINKYTELREKIGRLGVESNKLSNKSLIGDPKMLKQTGENVQNILEGCDELDAVRARLGADDNAVDIIKSGEITDVDKYQEALQKVLTVLREISNERMERVAGQAQNPDAVKEQLGAKGAAAESQGAINQQALNVPQIGEYQRQVQEENAKSVIAQENYNKALGQTVTSVAQVGMSLTMFTGQVESLGSAWGDGKVSLEDFTGGLMALGSYINTLSSIMRIFNGLQDMHDAKVKGSIAVTKLQELAEKENTDSKQKNIIAERIRQAGEQKGIAGKIAAALGMKGLTTATDENTAATETNTVAWYSNPVTAVIAAVMLAVAGAVLLVTKAIQSHTQALQENAEEAASAAEKSQQEADSALEQKKAYEEAYKAYKEGSITKEEFLEKVKSVATALDNESIYVKAQQEDYAALNETLDETIKRKAILAQSDATKAVDTAMETAHDKAGKGNGIGWDSDTNSIYGARMATNGITASSVANRYADVPKNENGIASKEEQTKLLNKFISDYDLGETFSVNDDWSSTTSTIGYSIDTTDPNKVSQAYDDTLKMIQAMRQEGASDEAIQYWEGLKDQLLGYLDAFDKVGAEANATMTVIESKNKDFKEDLDSEFDLSNPEEYAKAIKRVKDALKAEGMSEEHIETLGEDYFENLLTGINPDEVGLKNKVDNLGKQIFGDPSKMGESQRKQVEEFIQGLSEEDLSSLQGLEIPIDGQKSFEKFQAWWDQSKDERELQQKVDLLPTLQNALEASQDIDYDKAYKEEDLQFITDAGLNIEDYFTQDAITHKWKAAATALSLPDDIRNQIIETNTKQLGMIRDNFAEEAEHYEQLAAGARANAEKQRGRDQDDFAEKSIKRAEGYEAKAKSYSDMAAKDENGDYSMSSYNQYVASQADLRENSNRRQEVSLKGDRDEYGDVLADIDAAQRSKEAWGQLAAEEQQYRQEIANTATSVADLNDMLKAGQITALEYSEAHERMQETERLAGLKMEDVAELAKVLANQYNETNKELIRQNPNLKKSAKDFSDQAAAILQAEKAIKDLKTNFKSWSQTIKDGNAALAKGDGVAGDYTAAMGNMKKSMGALLDVASDDISNSFLSAENLDLLEKALNNDADAADQLQANFQAAAMDNFVDQVNSLSGADLAAVCDAFTAMGIEGVNSQQDIINKANELSDTLANIDDPNFDSSSAIQSMQALLNSGQFTVEQLEEMYNIKIKTKAKTEPQEQKIKTPPKITETWHATEGPSREVQVGVDENNKPITYTEKRYNWSKSVDVQEGQEITGTADAYAANMTADGSEPAVPEIESISKGDSVGSRIRAAGGGKGTGSSGGGGGGGGGGSAKKPKLKEADAKSRYHRVDKQIEKSKDEYDQIGKARERAYGPKVLQYMQQELELLRQQKELTHQKRLEAEAYLKEDLAALNGYAAEANFTVTYDESGIVNYEDLKKKADEYYNAHVTGDSDADEWLEKWYDHFTKMLDQYEETLKVIRDQTNEEFEFERQMLDNQLEQIQWNVDLKLEINESVKKYWDYMDSRLESLVEEAEKLNYLISKVDAIKKISGANMDVATQGLIDQFGVIGVDSSLVELLSKQIRGELPEDQSDWSETYLQLVKAIQDAGDENNVLMEKLKEYIDVMVENVQAQADVHKEALDQEEELFNTALEDLDKKFEKFGKIVEEIGMYGDVVDALGKRASGAVRETLAAIRNARINATSEQINALGSEITKREPELQNLQKEYDEKKAKYNSSSISQAEKDSLGRDINKLKSQIDTLSDYLDSKKSDWQSAIVDLAGQVKENFSAAINDIIDDFDYAISDMYASVEELQKAYDQRRTLEEQYIPEYKQVYELNKISRDLSKQLDTTDSLAAQKKLRDFQKEIYDLQNSGKKLSEYDLEYLQKKYDLRVAEIALEDAQNAKNQVRLSRDAEGNYSYVYTADEENTDQAVQDYEDKMYALQELSENRLKDVGSDYLAAVKEMEDSLRELADQDLTESQKNVAVAEIEKMFKERVAFLSLQNKQILKNNEDLYKNDYANYSKMTKNISAQTEAFMMRDKDFTTGFSDTILGSVLGSYESLDDHASSTLALLEAEQGGVLSKIDAAYDEFEAQMTETYSKLGLAWNNHMEDLKGDQRLVEFLRGNVIEYETYKTRASEELEQVGDKASHEAGRIISHFSGKENSGHDAAWYLDAMATSGANAARIFQEDFNSAASTLLSNLNDGKGNGIEPKLLGSADSAKIFADNAKTASENVDTAKGSVSNFTTEMINALTKAEGEEGYLAKLKSAFSSNLTGTDHESVESITVNAGEYVSTKFINPSEQAITDFSEWMTKTGIPGFSVTMGQYTAVADPEKIKQNMEGAEDPFKDLPDKVDQYLPNWEAEVNKWAGKVTDIGGAAGSTSTKVGETFSGIPDKIKMPTTIEKDINNWTTTLSLLGNAFTNINKTSSKAAEGIEKYNKESPKNYSASTTIASNVADVIDKIITYNGTEPTNWDTSVNVSWKDDFENFIKKDSNFNKNLDAINQKTGTVQVNYKDTWTDEFNTQIQEHMNDLTDKVIKIKYEIDDSALVNDNNANNMASAGQLATLMLRHSARLNDMISNGNDTGNGATIGGIYNDQSFSAKDARLFLQYASFGESALKGLEDWQKNRFFQFLQEYIAGDLQFRENGKIIGYASSFSSGGYTGDWGDSGKLAMLHQKELVLNQADTSNILAAVDLVRQAAQAIDLSARASQYAMGSNLAAATTASIVNSNDLNQNVTIYAEFPGVSVEAEIQNAFNAMEMQAIQYAHRDY